MRLSAVLSACIVLVSGIRGENPPNISFSKKPPDEEFADSYIDSVCSYEKERYVNGMKACREDYEARQSAIRTENARLRHEVDSLNTDFRKPFYRHII